MRFQMILDEVEQLHGVGARLEGLSEQFAHLTKELLAIAGNVHDTATLLSVLIATKRNIHDGLDPS